MFKRFPDMSIKVYYKGGDFPKGVYELTEICQQDTVALYSIIGRLPKPPRLQTSYVLNKDGQVFKTYDRNTLLFHDYCDTPLFKILAGLDE